MKFSVHVNSHGNDFEIKRVVSTANWNFALVIFNSVIFISDIQFNGISSRDIENWMTQSKLKLNNEKMKFMIIGTKQQHLKQSVQHWDCSVMNLGITFDTSLSLDKQISKTFKSLFYYLYNMKIRKILTAESCTILIYAFITCCLDYCI